jgi:ATP-dependent DNA ligase
VHEIKLDGYRMAARIDKGRVQLLTRTGLDWTDRYSGAIATLMKVNVKTAYIDGELCGVDAAAGLPSFAQAQGATDGDRGSERAIVRCKLERRLPDLPPTCGDTRYCPVSRPA